MREEFTIINPHQEGFFLSSSSVNTIQYGSSSGKLLNSLIHPHEDCKNPFLITYSWNQQFFTSHSIIHEFFIPSNMMNHFISVIHQFFSFIHHGHYRRHPTENSPSSTLIMDYIFLSSPISK
jgi:hypothetical protein